MCPSSNFGFLDTLEDVQQVIFMKLNSIAFPVRINDKRYKKTLYYLEYLINIYANNEVERFHFVNCV